MKKQTVEISPGAAFLAALLLLYLRNEELLALAIPVMIHELGHLAAILALGQRVTGFRADLCGFTMDWSGEGGPWREALIAAAGPLAGLLFALTASLAGVRCGWLCLAAGVSLLLSLFNLLPILPLDGGRLLSCLACARLGEERGERVCGLISLWTSGALAAGGAILLLRGGGAALLTAGLALLFRSLREQGLVKKGKIR